MTDLKILKGIILILALAAFSNAEAVTQQARQAALEQFALNHPQTHFYEESSRISNIYGAAFGGGTSPEDAAEGFRAAYAPVLGVDADELLPVTDIIKDGHTLPVMYLQETGQYKFTLVYYSQFRDGIPVYKSELRLLTRNEPAFPLVLAVSSLRDLGDYHVDPAAASISPEAVRQSFAVRMPQYVNFTEPRRVIWAGVNEMKVDPILGIEFIADDGQHPTTNRNRFIIDPVTGDIIYQEDLVIDVDVTGQVNGLATENFKAEQCGNEISTALPWARVYISSGSPYFADSTGHFVITNGGSSPVTVTSYVRGRWFQTWNQAGAESFLTQTVTPPGPANFLHNPANTEYTRAEVNGYVQANIVRDFTLKYNPSYPVIDTQVNFPVYVNDNTGYCPGNAWYDGLSITFCRAAGGYPNTAFSTVVHHEYGHHLVQVAGSGQGQYGEGMGDVMGNLITDNPGAAWGFFGPCNQALRNADNSYQYPCSGEIHDCGQLISGCVWSTRNELAITHPTDYIDILANLVVNSIHLHLGDLITPSITIAYLTVDDDDGNIDNGTPHHAEICAGFGAHNMDCPPLSLLAFTYPNGLPDYINPSGGTTVRVQVTGIGGTPQQNTGELHYNAGSGWITLSMTQVSPNVYDGVFPAFTCGTSVNYYFSARTTNNVTVTDPSNAPTGYYITISGTGITNLYQDDFSTNQGWTGLGGSGEWTIGVATGGAGNDSYGLPDPAVDHSPSNDNKVLGNDLTSGSGGDYSANLALTYWVTSPTVNCSGRSGIRLSFYRWLGVERNIYDHAYFQVYNGTSWVTLYQNPDTTKDESSWSRSEYNVSTYANNNPNFKFRFGLGTTDVSWQYCGWNIDDILVTSIACDTVQNGIIAGNVTDAVGAINAAIVHATGGGYSVWDTTASNGAYSISIHPSTYSVAFTHIDHRDTTVSGVVVTAGNTTTLNVNMQRLPGMVKGTVTRSPGNPIGDVRVIALGSGLEDTTASNGAYAIAGLPDGSYNIRFTNLDYRDTTVSGVTITPGDTTILNVAMQQLPGWILGTVRDTSGAAIESVYVVINSGALGLSSLEGTKAFDDGGEPILLAIDSMYTNSSGYYSSRLVAATYHARFSKRDYRDTTISGIVVTPGDTTNVSPTIRRRNHPPVITSPASATATEDIFFRYIAAASDSDGVIPVISFSNYPSWMSVFGDSIQGTPLNGDGNTSFRLIASDGYLADTQVVAVTVIPVNDPPVITSPDTATAREHILFTYSATATDPDNTPTITFVNYPPWLAPSGATISGIPPEGAPDTSFTVIASDGSLADTMNVALAVLLFDDPPIITSPSTATATEDIYFSYLAVAMDPEGAPTTISLDNYPAWMIVAGDTISGTPHEGDSSTSFRIIASDGSLTDTLTVVVTVLSVNDPPQITSPDTATATEHRLFTYLATATDPDGTSPTISFANYPSWLSPSSSSITGTPQEGDGAAAFMVIASDGSLADSMLVVVTVIEVNDPPVITSPASAVAIEGEQFEYLAAAVDPEGTTPIISFADYASWLTVNEHLISGAPGVGEPDTTFKVIASDGFLAETLTVTLAIIEPNRAPIITSPATATATEHQQFQYTATASDPDGTTPAISITAYASWMNVSNNTVTGIPGENTTDTTFTIIATDGLLNDTLIVDVNVILINDPPLITSPAADTAIIGIPYVYTATAFDPEGTSLLYTFSEYPSWLIVSGNSLVGVPPEGSIDATFMVVAYDGELADSLLVYLTVMGGCDYIIGDVNGSGIFNGIDITYMVGFFKGGAAPTVSCDCPPNGTFFVQGDVNSSCTFNGLDVTFSVTYFKGGASPSPCADCPPAGPAMTSPGENNKPTIIPRSVTKGISSE